MNRKVIFGIVIIAIILAIGSVLVLSGVVNLSPAPAKNCVVAGCSSELCIDENDTSSPRISMCIWSNKYKCYQTATCEVQSTGKCGWTSTNELNACLLETE
jgi:hypothetical protein